jgi:hypothetical protein
MSLVCPVCNRSFDDAFLADHLENAHHEPQQREGETAEEMLGRFLRDNPSARECLLCFEASRAWSMHVKPSKRFGRKAETFEE